MTKRASPLLSPLPLLSPDMLLGGGGHRGVEGEASGVTKNVSSAMAWCLESTVMSFSLLPKREAVLLVFQFL